MRISVNLASRPFVELRPFLTRLRIVMAVLAVVAIALGIVMHFESQKLTVAEQQMDAVRRRTITAQEEKLHNEARMRQKGNAEVLNRAHFLNELFLRKSFSWTAVMMDLETVLPTGVQVTSIEPQITPDGDVVIRLRVSGDRDRAIQLVRNLERSARFIAPRLSSETTQTKEQAAAAAANGAAPGGVEFEILANYNPLTPAASMTAASSKSASSNKTPAAKGEGPDLRVKRAKHPANPGRNDGVVLPPYASPRSAPAKPAGSPR
jgi:type IV pilus assembly protein PilN